MWRRMTVQQRRRKELQLRRALVMGMMSRYHIIMLPSFYMVHIAVFRVNKDIW
jgi:hypothetical protein